MSDHPIVKSVHGKYVSSGLPQPIASERADVEGPIKEAAKAAKVNMNIPVKQMPGLPPGVIAEVPMSAIHPLLGVDQGVSRQGRLDLTKLRRAWGADYEVTMRSAVEKFVRKGTLETVEQMIAGTGVDTDTLVLISRLGGRTRAKKRVVQDAHRPADHEAINALYGNESADDRGAGGVEQDTKHPDADAGREEGAEVHRQDAGGVDAGKHPDGPGADIGNGTDPARSGVDNSGADRDISEKEE